MSDQPLGMGVRKLEESRKKSDYRTDAERDYDRIIYSSAFLRLGGVAQVSRAADGCVVHNRLTHSLKVARIGKGLAVKFTKEFPEQVTEVGGIDPDTVECASLAHDLGHPPFGHLAEKELDRLLCEEGRTPDGFEGNAQTFRVVTRLAVRSAKYEGLNLSARTLGAISKYPWHRERTGKRSKKWGAYQTESDYFRWLQANSRQWDGPSPEAQIMDLADDIAYSTHDVEDYYRAGLIPLDRLLTETGEADRFLAGTYERWKELDHAKSQVKEADYESAWKRFVGFLKESSTFYADLNEPYQGKLAQRAAIHSLTSFLINRFFQGVTLRGKAGADDRFLQVSDEEKLEIDLLKELVWHYVIRNPAMREQARGQQEVIRTLFRILTESLDGSPTSSIFSERFRERLKKIGEEEDPVPLKHRMVADLICELTEHQAYEKYSRLTGHLPSSFLDSMQR